MPIRAPERLNKPERSNKWRPLALCAAMILFIPPMISAGANQTGTPDPWIVTAKIMLNERVSATAIYLKPGLVVTAAHLTPGWTDDLSVHIAGTALPATLVKQGDVDDVDLSLFSVDDEKLPGALREFRRQYVKHLLGREIRSSLWIREARPGPTSSRRSFCQLSF